MAFTLPVAGEQFGPDSQITTLGCELSRALSPQIPSAGRVESSRVKGESRRVKTSQSESKRLESSTIKKRTGYERSVCWDTGWVGCRPSEAAQNPRVPPRQLIHS